MIFQIMNSVALGVGYVVIIIAAVVAVRSIGDAFLYAAGYTIYMFLSLNYAAIRKRPLRFIWTVAVDWFLVFFMDRLLSFGETLSVSDDDWVWEPYFKYRKKKKGDEQ